MDVGLSLHVQCILVLVFYILICFILALWLPNTLISMHNIAKACKGDAESCTNATWSKLRPEYVFNFKGIIPIVNKEILDIARCIIFSKLKR